MSDSRNALQSMFREDNRHANFGDMLMRIHVRGFRCHINTVVEIASPITALCGLNGTGKSTLLQLAAAAYKGPDRDQVKPYYIKDFLVVGTLDPAPFTDEARVEYKYWQVDHALKTVTISRNAETKRWAGYAGRPQRQVLFAGIGLYLPRIEQRDFIVRNARSLTVLQSNVVADHIRNWTCRILGHNYDSVLSNMVAYSQRTAEVVSVERSGITYSEAHMGYGEGRSQYLISMLETLPERSLVLVEEPETSLHLSAQYEFGQYLVDAAMRKRHQILLTTHSEFMLKALPSASIVYLKRTEAGIDTVPGLTALQAKSLMTEGQDKALYILVEDECAKAILSEIIRRVDPDFLRSIGIHVGGNADAIGKTVRSLEDTGLSVAAVRDADQGDDPKKNIFKLPGNAVPENELFSSDSVKGYMQETYGINLDDFAATLADVDHHEWLTRLADRVSQERSALTGEVARAYARGISEADASTLTDLLKEASRK